MKARIIFVLSILGTMGFGMTASAKPLSRIIAEMGLSPSDFEVASKTSRALLTDGTPSVGKEMGWANGQTGSQGTIRIIAVEGNCVRLEHDIQPQGEEASRGVRTRQCKDAEGNWVMAP